MSRVSIQPRGNLLLHRSKMTEQQVGRNTVIQVESDNKLGCGI